MSCWHTEFTSSTHETAFSIDPTALSFGPGVLREVGEALHGCRRVALFTDPRVRALPMLETVLTSLRAATIDFEIFDEIEVEPTDRSFAHATRFAQQGRFDGFVSLGGGSVIDTAKAAALYATFPEPLLTFVNAPAGEGRPIPGPLPVHVACPTTCGTGSECTGIAVFDHRGLQVKTGIASRRLRPTRALIDPTATQFLPPMVVAASGFDVLCHALESYTARPHLQRAAPASASARPMSQGSNPWSDLGSFEALRLGGRFLVRAVHDADDAEARQGLSWAATLAGVAFGNSGVHLPHAMSYAVAGLVKDFHCDGYPEGHALVPHGLSVVVNAPAVFRATYAACPQRHVDAARALGFELDDVRDAAQVLSQGLERLMTQAKVPRSIGALGYREVDVPALTRGAMLQKRLLDNAPLPVDASLMERMFRASL